MNEPRGPRAQRRSKWFFGRRKAKALTRKQSERAARLLPKLAVDVGQSAPQYLNALFPEKKSAFVIEIGFGGGEHLVNQASAHPEAGFFGVEPFVNSMAKALRSIEDRDLHNIRLYNEDATELLDWLPEHSIDRIDLLYPDPWPKQRHWKRRFVNPENLDRMARVLKPGGRFHFASDIDSYVNWTLQHCLAHPSFAWLADGSADWKVPFGNWVQTRYEAKALREGRQPAYLRFGRV